MKYRFGLHDQTDYKVKENPPKNQPFPQFFFKKICKGVPQPCNLTQI